MGNSGALEEEYVIKTLRHGYPLRASVLDTYTSTIIASSTPKQKKVRREQHTREGASSKQKIPLKKVLLQSDILGSSREEVKGTVVKPKARRLFRLDSIEEDDDESH